MEHGNAHTDYRHELKASADLLADIRAAFVRKGTSLSAWCRDNGVHRQNAAAALKGSWKGPSAAAMLARVAEAARS